MSSDESYITQLSRERAFLLRNVDSNRLLATLIVHTKLEHGKPGLS